MKNHYAAIALAAAIVSCGDRHGTEAAVDEDTPPADVEISLTAEGCNDITFEFDRDAGVYSFVSGSSGDPYVFSEALAENLQEEHAVLSFEYLSSAAVDDLQFFFPSPHVAGGGLSEARSCHCGEMAAASSWTEFAFDIAVCRSSFDGWGRSGDYLRIDFGHAIQNAIQIKNIRIRPRNSHEQAEFEEQAAARKAKEDKAVGIEAYLSSSYPAAISYVSVGANSVTVKGRIPSEKGYFLVDIAPWEDLTLKESFPVAIPVTGRDFALEVPRTVFRDGIPSYDRVLSKWVLVSEGKIASHARYADDIALNDGPAGMDPSSKKGLGGFTGNQLQLPDLDDLGISSVTVNVVLNTFINTEAAGNFSIPHTYGGVSYYMNRTEVASLDRQLQACASRNILVSAIILVRPSDGNAASAVMTHPEYAGGHFSMPNLTEAASVNLYAAALDYLAARYDGGVFGRINHWILHNEVDCAEEWTNMGNQPEAIYMDAYVKSMRICYLTARKYDSHSSALISLTHCWNRADGQYAPKSLLADLDAHCKAEGDFFWGVAYHPYPQNLFNPDFWSDDTQAIYSLDSPYCTFKNLEVLDAWAKDRSNWFRGEKKRIVYLSENGTNSPSYSDADLARQAAGACWMWKKVSVLDGIDAVQWHNWRDNQAEGGLMIGLRKFPEQGSTTKPVWDVYKAAGTSGEDAVFKPYLSVIGISDWSEIHHGIN